MPDTVRVVVTRPMLVVAEVVWMKLPRMPARKSSFVVLEATTPTAGL